MFPPTFCFAVPSGSVILHSRNPKKVAILPFDAITGEKLFCLSPVDMTTLDNRFLAYQLQTDHFHEFVGRWLSGSVNKFLNWTALERYEFALPPLDEQQRIVDVLRVSQRVVEQQIALSESLVSIGRSIVRGVARFTRTAKLGEIAELRIGKTPPRDNPAYWDAESKLPFCTIADMSELVVFETKESISSRAVDEGKAKRFPAGTLMMSFKLTIGKVAFAGVDLWPNEAIVGIEPHGGEQMTKYLSWVLQVVDLTRTSDRAVKGKTLNLRKIRDIEVPLVDDDVLPGLLLQLRALELMIERCRSAVTHSRAMHRALQSHMIGARVV
jgi:type I restriction enzyme S subunit